MPIMLTRLTVLSALAALALALPVSAVAQDADGSCTYEDLHGEFTITVACAGLQNFSGNSQPMKRLWLDGPLGEVHIMEAPSPYQTVELEVLLKTLGRYWTGRRSAAIRTVQLAGGDALIATRRQLRTSSRTLVFKLGGRNITARLAVVTPRAQADAALDALEAEVLGGFALKATAD
jgi:hypothetical protein